MMGLAMAFWAGVWAISTSVRPAHLNLLLRLPRHRRRLVDSTYPFDFDGNQSDDLAVAARPAMFTKRLFHKALHHDHHHHQVPPLGLRRFHLTFLDPTNQNTCRFPCLKESQLWLRARNWNPCLSCLHLLLLISAAYYVGLALAAGRGRSTTSCTWGRAPNGRADRASLRGALHGLTTRLRSRPAPPRRRNAVRLASKSLSSIRIPPTHHLSTKPTRTKLILHIVTATYVLCLVHKKTTPCLALSLTYFRASLISVCSITK